MTVDLVNQRQIAMSPLPGDLINTNRLNTRQVLMLTSPDHRTLHRAEHMIPGGAKCLGHFLPAQPLCPAGQEPGIRIRRPANSTTLCLLMVAYLLGCFDLPGNKPFQPGTPPFSIQPNTTFEHNSLPGRESLLHRFEWVYCERSFVELY